MAQPLRTSDNVTHIRPVTTTEVEIVTRRDPEHQAYQILHFAYIVAPLVAGVDKFVGFLADWSNYLAPAVTNVTGIAAPTFMQIVGGIEIIAAIGVALRPRFFGYVVGVWLLGIVANLIMTGQFYDIALRDFGLALGAFALARLAKTQWVRRVQR